MRIIIFTGKGGVGKTTSAAATAIRCAELGQKTLVTSLDIAHSLGDCFGIELDSKPKKIANNLWAQEAEMHNQFIKEWRIVTSYFKNLLLNAGIDEVLADEIPGFSAFPGFPAAYALSKIEDYAKTNKFDTVILDCPPTGETLRLLSASNSFRWYMSNFYDAEKKTVNFLRPVLENLKRPIPPKIFYGALESVYNKIVEIEKTLQDNERCSVRLVLNPEKMIVDETKRAFTYINLFNYRVDGIIVNKCIPNQIKDQFFDRWKEIQAAQMSEIEKSFSPTPLFKINLMDDEMIGLASLSKMARLLYGDRNPAELFLDRNPFKIYKKDGKTTISLYLPGAEKKDMEVFTNNEELLINLKSYERKIILPSSLINASPEKTSFENGYLEIMFDK